MVHKVYFLENQYCDSKLLFSNLGEYECVGGDSNHYLIKETFNGNSCTSFSKSSLGKVFNFVESDGKYRCEELIDWNEHARESEIIWRRKEEEDIRRSSRTYGEDDGVYRFKVTTTNSSNRTEIVTIIADDYSHACNEIDREYGGAFYNIKRM